MSIGFFLLGRAEGGRYVRGPSLSPSKRTRVHLSSFTASACNILGIFTFPGREEAHVSSRNDRVAWDHPFIFTVASAVLVIVARAEQYNTGAHPLSAWLKSVWYECSRSTW